MLRYLVAGLAFTCVLQSSCGLDPARSLSQYLHSQWGRDKGFFGETIYAICQSGDGYLWIGTDRGLVRFDGQKFNLIQKPLVDQPAIGPVRGLVEGLDGALWIRSQGPQLLLYRDGHFTNAFAGPGLPSSIITAMTADRHGGVLFSQLVGPSIRYAHGRFETVAESAEATGVVTSLAETLDGRVWLGTRDDGLLVINDGKPLPSPSPNLENDKINALAATDNGGLWIGTDQGLRFRSTRGDIDVSLPDWNRNTQIFDLAQGALGNVWAASNRGLIRIAGGGFSVLSGGGKKPGIVTAVYEDRSGSVWFGGPNGLERLEDGLFATYSSRDGFPASNGGALHVDAGGRIWFAPVSGGLYFLDEGRVRSIRLEGLDRDVVYSISGTGNDIWAGRQRGGLTKITIDGKSVSRRTYTRTDGLAQNTVFATYAARDGGVWAGTTSGGLSRLKDGVFTNYSTSNGLSSNAVNSIVEGFDGTVWVGTSAGLDAFRNGVWSHWSRTDGLPSSEVRNCFEDSQDVLWLLTASGIAYLSSGKVVIPNHIPEALRDPLFGITEDRLGFLWFSTSDHVIRVKRSGLLADTLHDTDVRMMGETDGLARAEGVRRDRSIITGPDARIWVSVQNGIAVTNPALSLRQSTPVPARIESINAAGTIFRPGDSLRIPARTRSITFQFSGATLDSPERIWFRYLLEGADQTWSDPVQVRQIGYNNLRYGTYRFRVMASHDGVLWNGPENDAAFSIDQAFWETWWFRTGWVILAGMTMAFIIRLRMLRLSSQLNARFQERLAERTRIARELHDTLLQSLHGLMFKFQAARNMLPRKPEDAMQTLDKAISETEQAIAESRDAIYDLRSQPVSGGDLAPLLEAAGEELAAVQDTNQDAPGFRVIVEGEAKKLYPKLQDEAYRIARELLRNAFRHAEAGLIEAEIRYDKNQLRLRIRDDGKGIGPKVLEECRRPGHWGLPGVRERAQSIGAQLSFWSQAGAGTEIELTIPAAVAYEGTRKNGHRFKLFRKEQKL